ncbi:hypothetical protein PPH41_38690, partial [Burkholderia gladioli]|nr:hypothetical protein [Burkholderia gladioli]
MSIDFGSNGNLLTMLAGASNAPSASASNAGGSIRAAISLGANRVTLALNPAAGRVHPGSFTHLTLPTDLTVEVSGG